MQRSKSNLVLKSFVLVLGLGTLVCLIACGPQNKPTLNDSTQLAGGLRQLNQKERAEDFDQLLSLFKAYYGPYEYKEKLLGINIEKEAARLKDLAVNAKTEEEFAGYVNQFGALLKDGHVSLAVKNTASGISRYTIPIFIEQVEAKVLVSSVEEQLTKELGIEEGDEILEIDNKSPFEYIPLISKYMGSATKSAEKEALSFVFYRRSYMSELIPNTTSAKIKFSNAEGVLRTIEVPWEARKYNSELDKILKPAGNALFMRRNARADDLNSLIKATTIMGEEAPFFITEKAHKKYNFLKQYPSDAARKKAELGEKEKPPIFAALYRYENKNILLVRIADYAPSDYVPEIYLKAYKALLTEFQPMADVLVLDQTNNAGGTYCNDFFELFAKEQDVQTVQRCNADRNWINKLSIDWPRSHTARELPWEAKQAMAMSVEIEKAYDNGARLSAPIALFSKSKYVDPKNSVWKKPMLVLIDHNAASCGDEFPMLIKANKRAKLFGETTMGLGGSTEMVGTLHNSRISVNLTRGLFAAYKPDDSYKVADYVENNGVTPDIAYTHTVKDVRAGYIDYIKTFSDEAVKLAVPSNKETGN